MTFRWGCRSLSVYEVTFADYDRFSNPRKVDDEGWGRGRHPVINVSWDNAKEYVTWLSAQTGAQYRLPSEAEWEYAARAGTTTRYSWGDENGVNRANCGELCGDPWTVTAPVGSFAPNPFGLYDMHGNVHEWVEDCWNESYQGAPSNGGAWLQGSCGSRVFRGGAFFMEMAGNLGVRYHASKHARVHGIGFRVARTLTP